MPSRYGTGELYGFDFSTLPAERVRELSSAQYKSLTCPFKPVQPGKPAPKCNKKGGVCSLRQFVQDVEGQVEGRSDPVVTCPSRFLEGNLIAQWVGETLLGTSRPVVISELPFLMGEIQAEEQGDQDAVGLGNAPWKAVLDRFEIVVRLRPRENGRACDCILCRRDKHCVKMRIRKLRPEFEALAPFFESVFDRPVRPAAQDTARELRQTRELLEAALQRVNAVLGEPPAVTRARKPVRPAVQSAAPREATLSLAALRTALGWSRALLASVLNCSERALVNWEQGGPVSAVYAARGR